MQFWWENKDAFDQEDAVLDRYSGPEGVATVKVFDSGKTQPGWGDADFMKNYKLGKMRQSVQRTQPFAYVMRSLDMIVVDVDARNDGYQSLKALNLPRTLAETSKSGEGLHLWFVTSEEWDDQTGYSAYSDRIGLMPGIDIRGVGCVFHYPQQRWNNEFPAFMPEHLANKLLVRQQMTHDPQVLSTMMQDDPIEAKRLIQQILKTAEQPIKAGNRNQTLFAMSSQLFLLGYEDWEEVIRNLGYTSGLPDEEVEKIIGNAMKYAARS